MPDTDKAPSAAEEALRQLGADANAIAGGQVTMREYVTAEEHALLLAVRALKDAKQAYADANNAMSQALNAMNNAGEASVSAQRSYENALAQLTDGAMRTGEDDCS